MSRRVEIETGQVERAQLRGLAVGAEAPFTDDLMTRAVEAAANAEVAVVVVGTNADWETEGEDRTTMDLPGAQDELVRRVAAANPNTVVVINAGSPVTMPWLDEVAAVMQIWFPGEELGEALVDLLFGDAEPAGRLPITVPKRLEDTPAFAFYPGVHDHMAYGEGLLIGHRWYDREGIEPAFPFGHGLGYTTWTMGAAALDGSVASDDVAIEVEVRNTGARTGTTVVQCYVEPATPLPGRPLRTLQGFAKVTVDAGATTTVRIPVPRRAFQRWDVAAHQWVLVGGEHTVHVGWSSRDLVAAIGCRADASV